MNVFEQKLPVCLSVKPYFARVRPRPAKMPVEPPRKKQARSTPAPHSLEDSLLQEHIDPRAQYLGNRLPEHIHNYGPTVQKRWKCSRSKRAAGKRLSAAAELVVPKSTPIARILPDFILLPLSLPSRASCTAVCPGPPSHVSFGTFFLCSPPKRP